jgi:hypothetical protein
VIAASLMISQPFASQAAGTVSHTSAESFDHGFSYRVSVFFFKKKTNDILKSATAPMSLVIWSFAYSQRQLRKSIIRSMALFPGYRWWQ